MQRVDWHNRRSGTGVDAEFANYDVLRLLATSEYNAVYVQSAPTSGPGVGAFFMRRGNQTSQDWSTILLPLGLLQPLII